jgi:FtsH-binding integral membrane protein
MKLTHRFPESHNMALDWAGAIAAVLVVIGGAILWLMTGNSAWIPLSALVSVLIVSVAAQILSAQRLPPNARYSWHLFACLDSAVTVFIVGFFVPSRWLPVAISLWVVLIFAFFALLYLQRHRLQDARDSTVG